MRAIKLTALLAEGVFGVVQFFGYQQTSGESATARRGRKFNTCSLFTLTHYLINHAAAQNQIPVVEYHTLPTGQGSLGGLKDHLHRPTGKNGDPRRLLRVVVSGSGPDGDGGCGFCNADPIEVSGHEPGSEQTVIVRQHHRIALRANFLDIEGSSSADAQSPALSNGIMDNAPVSAQKFEGVHDVLHGVHLFSQTFQNVHVEFSQISTWVSWMKRVSV